MSHYWVKKDPKPENLPPVFRYRGLEFPLYQGYLTKEELKSGVIFFAFFGGRKLSEKGIQYHVDRMIESGEYRPPQAA